MCKAKHFPLSKILKMRVYLCIAFIVISSINVDKVWAEKSGWLCDEAFSEDIPAVYFPGLDIINACISMRLDDFLRAEGNSNVEIRSCTLQPDRQCMASRYTKSKSKSKLDKKKFALLFFFINLIISKKNIIYFYLNFCSNFCKNKKKEENCRALNTKLL